MFGLILGTTKEASFIRCCHGWRRHRTTRSERRRRRRWPKVRVCSIWTENASFFVSSMDDNCWSSDFILFPSVFVASPVDAADASSCRALALPCALCGALEPVVLVIFWAENLEREIIKSNKSKENWGPVKVNFLLVEREILEKINIAEITSVVLWRKLLAATMTAK
jgi:hypothetical protein